MNELNLRSLYCSSELSLLWSALGFIWLTTVDKLKKEFYWKKSLTLWSNNPTLGSGVVIWSSFGDSSCVCMNP